MTRRRTIVVAVVGAVIVVAIWGLWYRSQAHVRQATNLANDAAEIAGIEGALHFVGAVSHDLGPCPDSEDDASYTGRTGTGTVGAQTRSSEMTAVALEADGWSVRRLAGVDIYEGDSIVRASRNRDQLTLWFVENEMSINARTRTCGEWPDELEEGFLGVGGYVEVDTIP